MNKVDRLRLEAQTILDAEPANYALRSCWHCNSAHEHLRQSEGVLLCFDCGHWYYKGVDLTEAAPLPAHKEGEPK